MPAKGKWINTPEKIWSYVSKRKDNDCWPWTGRVHKGGYGSIRWRSKETKAHRLIFFLHNGFWPEVTRHTCDNKICVNPKHLISGTQAENIRDMDSRGRRYIHKGEKHGMSKLKERQVAHIKYLRSLGFLNCDVAKAFKVNRSVISSITKNKTWRHVEPSGV